MPEFYVIFAQKRFFPEFKFGANALCLVSYAYAKASDHRKQARL